jgi:hypothetical protein
VEDEFSCVVNALSASIGYVGSIQEFALKDVQSVVRDL